jgi:hypothetical protein
MIKSLKIERKKQRILIYLKKNKKKKRRKKLLFMEDAGIKIKRIITTSEVNKIKTIEIKTKITIITTMEETRMKNMMERDHQDNTKTPVGHRKTMIHGTLRVHINHRIKIQLDVGEEEEEKMIEVEETIETEEMIEEVEIKDRVEINKVILEKDNTVTISIQTQKKDGGGDSYYTTKEPNLEANVEDYPSDEE